jgi:cytochrome bd-type quinol oxidase subunit 2
MVKEIHALSLNFDRMVGTGYYGTRGAATGSSLERFFTILLGAFTTIGGIAFLLYFVLGSLAYLTSQGDREKIAKAQRYISNAVLGLLLLILAWAITGIIGIMLGFNILDLSSQIGTLYP